MDMFKMCDRIGIGTILIKHCICIALNVNSSCALCTSTLYSPKNMYMAHIHPLHIFLKDQ